MPAPRKELIAVEFGKAQLLRKGSKVAILAFGPVLTAAQQVADEIDASLFNMRFVKPLDEATVLQAAAEHDLIVTVEENAISGGAGSAVNECLAAQGHTVNILNLGFPDTYVGQGTQAEMLAEWGLDSEGLLNSINSRLKQLNISNCE